MPDEYFTILSSVPGEIENIRLLLRIIRQWDRDEFYKLLFEVYGMPGAEMEEKALRWRNSRLEEKGLLEFEEAVEIYGYIDEKEARRLARESVGRAQDVTSEATPDKTARDQAAYEARQRAGDTAGPSGVLPGPSHEEGGQDGVMLSYPLTLAESRSFLYEILGSIESREIQSRLRSEIAFSANRLLVADARSIGEIDSLQGSLRRLLSLANVGLLFLTGGDPEKAEETLHAVHIRDLFQIGFSRTADLRTLARAVAARWWPRYREDGFPLLDFPRDEVLSGLLRRVPQYYSLAEGGKIDFRDFETMEEVQRTRLVLEETAVIAEACFDALGIPSPRASTPDLRNVFASGIEEITLKKLLVTGYIRFSLHERFDISPLSRDDLKAMFGSMIQTGTTGEWVLDRKTVDRFLEWLHGKTAHRGVSWDQIAGFVLEGIKDLCDEIRKLPTLEDFDPLYVQSIIVTRQ
jgi:hypothetical protein